MAEYLIKRFIYMFVVLWLVSLVSFMVIQLPPGDYLSGMIASLEQNGTFVSAEQVEAMKARYGLDLPVYQRYFKWIGGFFVGDFGYSFEWNRPVNELIGERLLLTFFLSFTTVLFTYLMAIPIGVYSATHQYSWADHFLTTLGFIGLATPNFLLAMLILYLGFDLFGWQLDGLFSEEYKYAPWSVGKFLNMLMHIPIPVIVVGTAGTASLIRVMRASLLDELKKQYVVTARAKGVGETKLLFKYPVRIALNPIISEFAMVLPMAISAGAITDIVLGLPTAGPLLLRSLVSQDTYLAATILMFMTFLVVVGTTITDILLVNLDPRIKLEKGAGHD